MNRSFGSVEGSGGAIAENSFEVPGARSEVVRTAGVSPTATILIGDCRDQIRTLAEGSIDCIVTSIPYWGLRDYGVPPGVWGGDPACDHDWAEHVEPAANGIIHEGGMSGDTLSSTSATRKPKRSAFCLRCGAWRGCLGLEPTPQLFVSNIVEVFREARRVLAKTGTCWLNCGDTYASVGKWGGSSGGKHAGGLHGNTGIGRGKRDYGTLKAKDRCMIPARVAITLCDDGWWLRDEIIWHKPNPMPSSVQDRTTPAHEMLYLLTKSKKYFYNADAIRTPFAEETKRQSFETMDFKARDGYANGRRVSCPGTYKGSVSGRKDGPGQDRRSTAPRGGKNELMADQPGSANRLVVGLNARYDKAEANGHYEGKGANARSVWTISTQAFPEAHFATFPEELPKRCIMAGCPPGGMVLDMFGGSGTTIGEALRLGCSGIYIDLSPEYAELARKRINAVTPGMNFGEVA